MSIKLLRKIIPYEYESLASYIHRVSIENSCQVRWILSELKISKKCSINNINHLGSRMYVDYLASAFGVSNGTISRMLLFQYSLREMNSRNTLPDCVDFDFTSFCPCCLSEGVFQRIYWHVNLIYLCPHHKVLLERHCANCGKKITPKHLINQECSCGFDFSATKPKYISELEIVRMQNIILNALDIHTEEICDNEIFPLNMSGKDYISIVSGIYKLFIDYPQYAMGINAVMQEGMAQYPQLRHTLIAQKVISNYPDDFENIMDRFTKQYAKNDSLRRPFPTICEEFSRLYINHDLLWNYMRDALWNFFERYYENEIILDEVDQYTNSKSLKDLQRQPSGFDTYYEISKKILDNRISHSNHEKFKQVLKYFFLITKTNTFDDGQVTNATHLLETFKSDGIEIKDIFATAIRYKISIYVSPSAQYGLDIFYFPMERMNEELLKLYK